ncbi:unnamed protein product [Lactuca saligna]|uniref:Uncharacterized protein n=1 Tax=Lactuca saligna TaxID=75948 RepID=A0AA36E7Q8_LACSI|nr:unnamed protein product [Lactuca saligna]
MLVAYTKTIDPSIKTWKLLASADVGPSKNSRRSKKDSHATPEKLVQESKPTKSSKKQTKPEEHVSTVLIESAEPVIDEPAKVTIPSKFGGFQRLKKQSSSSRKSPTSYVVRKHHITHQGVLVREVPVPVSPSSKKRRTEDLAKRISKKKKKIKTQQLVIPTESSEEEEMPETPKATLITETSSPKKTTIIPPKVSSAKPFHEEARTSDITIYVSDTNVNVNMGEGDLNKEAPKFTQESENEEGGFGGTFKDLEFDEEEENFLDYMLISMKQFKILNKRLNSIIQSQADMGGSSFVSSLEIDGLLKAFEARMTGKVFPNDCMISFGVMIGLDACHVLKLTINPRLYISSSSYLLMEKMGEFKNKIFQDNHHEHTWGFMQKSDQESFEGASTISNGSSSNFSCSSLDTTDDASSSSSVNSNGSSLLDLSSLMSELPIKRGLSQFYHGKSESFTSLAKVMSIEDLPKKLKNPYTRMRKMKTNSKSYGGGLDNYKLHTLPKSTISKKLSPFLRQRSFARS